jgi:hypothetical protein
MPSSSSICVVNKTGEKNVFMIFHYPLFASRTVHHQSEKASTPLSPLFPLIIGHHTTLVLFSLDKTTTMMYTDKIKFVVVNVFDDVRGVEQLDEL